MASFERKHFPFSFAAPDAEDLVQGIKRIFCPVCGKNSEVETYGENRRESGKCKECGAWNRQRLMAWALMRVIRRSTGVHVPHLSEGRLASELQVYNAEWFGAIHETLRRLKGYHWSRYAGEEYNSGDVVDGHPHQDLTNTSFDDDQLDIVMTADVLEHIPDPYLAHREIHRVLRPGGVHVFTVPSNLNSPIDDQRAAVIDDRVVQLSPPSWHGKEVDSNLVYNVFGLEMIQHLWVLGFSVEFFEVSRPDMGIIGPRSFVFMAEKHHERIDRDVPCGLRARCIESWDAVTTRLAEEVDSVRKRN